MTDLDQLQADIDRVYLEYAAAREAWEKDPADPFIRRRWNRACEDLRETRAMWREIGVASGNRDTFVKTIDNTTDPHGADMIPVQITGRQHKPSKSKGDS